MNTEEGVRVSSKPRNSEDSGWLHVTKVNPNNNNDLKCNYCEVVTRGEICRAKQHIVGGYRNTKRCVKCPPHVREEIRDYMEKKTSERLYRGRMPDFDQIESLGDDEYEEDMESSTERISNQLSGQGSSKTQLLKKQKVKGRMDTYFTPSAEKVVQARRSGGSRQTTINEVCHKELRDKVCGDIARFFYDNGISFNAIKSESFAIMVESIGQFGPGLKPPSYHEIRVPLLRKELDATKAIMDEHKAEWAKYGCSIMSDGWRDEIAKKDIINFLVNSPKGSVFLYSCDASSYSKTADALYKLLDNVVED